VSFTQIFFNPALRNDASSDAKAALVELKSARGTDLAAMLGDRLLLDAEVRDADEQAVAGMFGPDYARAGWHMDISFALVAARGPMSAILAWLMPMIAAAFLVVQAPAHACVLQPPPQGLDTSSRDQSSHPHDCDGHDCEHSAHGHRHDHLQAFKTWSYETDAPLSLEPLREAARKLPASVYRRKGVVHTAEEPGRRVILQVVGKRVDIAVGDGWNGKEPPTRIIAIAARDGVDGVGLRATFDRCRCSSVS
jgi:hypothetical protein